MLANYEINPGRSNWC